MSNPQIKAIIWDWGNVLAYFNNTDFIEALSSISKVSKGRLEEIFYPENTKTLSLPIQYEQGLIDSKTFYRQSMKDIQISIISQEEFLDLYTDIFIPDKKTIKLAKRLSKDYTTGLQSNTSPADFCEGLMPIIAKYGLIFDTLSLSPHVGAMKPENPIYENTFNQLSRLCISRVESVFIDDIPEYAEKYKQMGGHGIHHTSFESTVQQLKDLGVAA
jgi:FMN phosphatase YigB (HAD superfamily)